MDGNRYRCVVSEGATADGPTPTEGAMLTVDKAVRR